MLEIPTWMNVHRGLSLSKGVLLLKQLQRFSICTLNVNLLAQFAWTSSKYIHVDVKHLTLE
jgi:hypothetical protein